MDFGHLGEPRSGRSAERPQAGRRGCARTKERDRGGQGRAGAEGHRSQRDQAGQRRASSLPRSAPQSLLLTGGWGAARSPYQPCPSHPPSAANPSREAHKERWRPALTSRRGGAAGGAGALRCARLKGPAAPREYCACPIVGRGGTGGRGRALPAAGWSPAVAARRSCACQRLRDPGRGAGRVQDPGAVQSGGRRRLGQALTAARFRLSEPRFQAGLSAAPGNGIAGARARATDVAGWRMPLCLVRSRAGGQSAPGATSPVRTRTSSPAFRCYPLGQTVDPSRSCTFVSMGGLFRDTNGTF